MSASLYLNRATQDTTEQCHQIDALALKACGIALTSQQHDPAIPHLLATEDKGY